MSITCINISIYIKIIFKFDTYLANLKIVNFIFTSLNINNENSQNHLVKKYTKFENDVEYYNQNFIEKYKEYIKKKNEINHKLFAFYNKYIFISACTIRKYLPV